MSQGDVSNPMDLVNGVCDRAVSDEGLKARLIADPRGTLVAETGLSIPDDWELVASQASDGTVQVGLVNEDIPETYLELVSGGVPGTSQCGTPPGRTYIQEH